MPKFVRPFIEVCSSQLRNGCSPDKGVNRRKADRSHPDGPVLLLRHIHHALATLGNDFLKLGVDLCRPGLGQLNVTSLEGLLEGLGAK